MPGFSKDANCDYKKAPFFNVLAAFWIQFMTHDWFSHLDEGHNADTEYMSVGCSQRGGPEAWAAAPATGSTRRWCAESASPASSRTNGKEYLERAPKTFAQQRDRVVGRLADLRLRRALAQAREARPGDIARNCLLMPADRQRLPARASSRGDPINPQWAGQEATAFPDNWTIGMSFYHNVFAREHNAFVDEFRRAGGADAGRRLRPARSRRSARGHPLPGRDAGRALRGGAPGRRRRDRQDPHHRVDAAAALRRAAVSRHERQLERTARRRRRDEVCRSARAHRATGLRQDPTMAEVARSGIRCSPPAPASSGSAAKYPTTCSYWTERHLEHRNPTTSTAAPTISARRSISPRSSSRSTGCTRWCRTSSSTAICGRTRTRSSQGSGRSRPSGARPRRDALARPANWALSMGRQRLGLLTLHNHPQFLQNLKMPRLESATQTDRRRGARPDPRPRARRAALQRIPPAVRAAAVDQLRRFHRQAAARGFAARRTQKQMVGEAAARGVRHSTSATRPR